MSNYNVSLILQQAITTPHDEDGSFLDEPELVRFISSEFLNEEYEYNQKQFTEAKAVNIKEIVYCDAKLSVEVKS